MQTNVFTAKRKTRNMRTNIQSVREGYCFPGPKSRERRTVLSRDWKKPGFAITKTEPHAAVMHISIERTTVRQVEAKKFQMCFIF